MKRGIAAVFAALAGAGAGCESERGEPAPLYEATFADIAERVDRAADR